MTSPLGEEFIRIRPDLSGFRAELNAQLQASLSGVQGQIAATQARLTRTATGSATLGGLPKATGATVVAQQKLATSTKNTQQQLKSLTSTSTAAAGSTRSLSRDLQKAETATGRYSRGMIAATAASTGFFRAVAFGSGAFLLGAAVGGAIGAAIKEFADMTRVAAQTNALIKATGGAANVTAAQVDALAQRVLNLTGIDDELVKSSANVLLTFRSIRDEVGQGNAIFDRAVKAVTDISSVFKTDLRGSAVQLGKALQDPIRGVTALRRSGITLSQSQRDLIKRLVETGRILSAQKIILGEVEHQVGGTAEAIGRTLPGRLSILRERSKNALGEYVKRVSESKKATELMADASQGLNQTFQAMVSVVRTLGPPLLEVAQALGRTTQALGGVGNLLAAVAAYKALSLAIRLAGAAQGFYTKATVVSTAATAANAAGAAGATAATVASTRATLALRASNALAARIAALSAARAVALGTGARFAALRLGALGIATRGAALGIAALGGPIGVAAIGLGALTIGLLKLRSAAQNAPGSLNATRRALEDLSNAIQRQNKLRTQLAGRREDVSLGRFNVQAAERDLARAQNAQATSGAAPGSLEQVHLTNAETVAEQKLAQANRDLATAVRLADIAQAQFAENQRSRQFVIGNTTTKLQEQIAALGRESRIRTVFGVPVGLRAFQRELSDTSKLKNFDALMRQLSQSSDGVQRSAGRALQGIRDALGRIPTQKEVSIIVRAIGRGMTTNQALALLGIGAGGLGREAGTEGVRLRGLAAQPTPSAAEEQRFLAAKALLNTDRQRLKVARETAATKQEELTTAREQLRAAREGVETAREQQRAARQGLADARETAREARQALADTIRTAHEGINQAITDAKGNLDQLGQAIADAFDKAGQQLGSSGNLGKRFQELRAQILRAGTPEAQRIRQRLATEAEGSRAAGGQGFEQRFSDLTDALNRGKISLPQFNRQFNALIKSLDIKAFRRQFGSAATNVLLDEIKAARKQAALIAGGPQRRGGGTTQTLVEPLKAVAQAGRDIASAQKDVLNAQRGIVNAQRDVRKANRDLIDAERRLRHADTQATKAQTAATKANTRASLRLADVIKARFNLEGGNKPKPKGSAGKDANDLTTAGAQTP